MCNLDVNSMHWLLTSRANQPWLQWPRQASTMMAAQQVLVQQATSLSAAEISRGTVEVVADIGIDQVLLSGAQQLGKSGACVPSLHKPARVSIGLQSYSALQAFCQSSYAPRPTQYGSQSRIHTCCQPRESHTNMLSSIPPGFKYSLLGCLPSVALRIECTQQGIIKTRQAYQPSPKQTCQICWACSKITYNKPTACRARGQLCQP